MVEGRKAAGGTSVRLVVAEAMAPAVIESGDLLGDEGDFRGLVCKPGFRGSEIATAFFVSQVKVSNEVGPGVLGWGAFAPVLECVCKDTRVG